MDTATGQNTPRVLVYTTAVIIFSQPYYRNLAFTRQNLHGARGQSRSVHSKNAKGLSVFVSASFKSCATPPPAHPVLQAD